MQAQLDEFYNENEETSTTKKISTKQKFLNFCKKFITFLVSRIGLMILMIGYVLAGESDNETKSLNLSENVLHKMIQNIYKQIENNSTMVKDEAFYNFIKTEIKFYTEFISDATRNGTLTGNDEKQWDFFGAVFYCVTLVSTIGYGHITCKTKFGKIFTIVYSAIGIPLMMTFLANIGSSTATIFKFIYLKFAIIKRKFRFKKIKSEHFLRSISAEHFDYIYQSSENLHKQEEEKPTVEVTHDKLNRTGSSSKADSRKLSTKLQFKTDEDTTESSLNPIDSKEKNVSNLKNREQSESKKSILVSTKDVKFEPVTQLIVDDDKKADSETKLIEAARRIEDLIEINLENNFEQKETEFFVGRDSDDLDEEITLKTNQFLLPKIFEYSKENESNKKDEKVEETKSSKKQKKNKKEKKELKKSKSDEFDTKSESANQVEKPKRLTRLELLKRSFRRISGKEKKKAQEQVELNMSHQPDQSQSMPEIKITEQHEKEIALKDEKPETTKQPYSKDITSKNNNFKNTKNGNLNRSKSLSFYDPKKLHIIYRQYQQEKQEKVGVPIFTVLIIIFCYLFCGMLMFSSFEEWKMLDALYFCFVTLTTIGFGDFIPGSTLLNKNGNKRNMLISALYIIIGLILISMCINLTSAQLKMKVKNFARKIGLGD